MPNASSTKRRVYVGRSRLTYATVLRRMDTLQMQIRKHRGEAARGRPSAEEEKERDTVDSDSRQGTRGVTNRKKKTNEVGVGVENSSVAGVGTEIP